MRDGPATSLAVCADASTAEAVAEAEALAARLDLPVVACDSTAFDVLLARTDERLEARQPGTRAGPVYVEFEAGRFGYRRSMPLRREAVVRAVGFKGDPLDVVDGTAGLGRDALVLASVGCRVTALERSAVVYELLADGLRRARHDPDLASVITANVTLLHADAVEYLGGLSGEPPASRARRPDVVYLDPMFPERSGSAVAKKELRLLARLVGTSEDAEALLAAAVASGAPRVVVKRPRLAPALSVRGAAAPGMRLEGRSSRFDVYFPTAR